jgi:hypothetical protein
MPLLTLVKGKKSSNDVLVLVTAYNEPLNFSEILYILDHYFKSEESYYPKPQYKGSCYFLEAILEIYSGIPFSQVLKNFKLENKLKIVDQLAKNTPSKPFKLEDVLKNE